MVDAQARWVERIAGQSLVGKREHARCIRQFGGTFADIEIGRPVLEKDDIDLEAELKKLMDEGMSKSEATKRVSKEYNIPKNEVYAVAVKL